MSIRTPGPIVGPTMAGPHVGGSIFMGEHYVGRLIRWNFEEGSCHGQLFGQDKMVHEALGADLSLVFYLSSGPSVEVVGKFPGHITSAAYRPDTPHVLDVDLQIQKEPLPERTLQILSADALAFRSGLSEEDCQPFGELVGRLNRELPVEVNRRFLDVRLYRLGRTLHLSDFSIRSYRPDNALIWELGSRRTRNIAIPWPLDPAMNTRDFERGPTFVVRYSLARLRLSSISEADMTQDLLASLLWQPDNLEGPPTYMAHPDFMPKATS